MGSYNSDSHNVERIVTRDGNVINEGDMQVGVKPYQIPYRIMVPRRLDSCTRSPCPPLHFTEESTRGARGLEMSRTRKPV